MLRIALQIDHGVKPEPSEAPKADSQAEASISPVPCNPTNFKIRIDGKLLGEPVNDPDGYKFLSFFERIRVQFPGNQHLYRPVDWVKAKAPQGSNFDSIVIERPYPTE